MELCEDNLVKILELLDIRSLLRSQRVCKLFDRLVQQVLTSRSSIIVRDVKVYPGEPLPKWAKKKYPGIYEKIFKLLLNCGPHLKHFLITFRVDNEPENSYEEDRLTALYLEKIPDSIELLAKHCPNIESIGNFDLTRDIEWYYEDGNPSWRKAIEFVSALNTSKSKLRYLWVPYSMDPEFELLSKCPNLRYIYLDDTYLDVLINHLISIEPSRNLIEFLNIQPDSFSLDHMKQINEVVSLCPSLRKLVLKIFRLWDHRDDINATSKQFKPGSKFEQLYVKTGQESSAFISGLYPFVTHFDVDMRRFDLTPDGLSGIENIFPRLERLELNDRSSFWSLNVGSFPVLRSLHVYESKLRELEDYLQYFQGKDFEKELISFIKSDKLSTIQDLTLSVWTKNSKRLLNDLAKNPNANKLESLQLKISLPHQPAEEITQEDIEALILSKPSLTILEFEYPFVESKNEGYFEKIRLFLRNIKEMDRFKVLKL